jgi:hypothetical protein
VDDGDKRNQYNWRRKVTMPAPQQQIMADLTRSNFLSQNIQVPENWQQPNDQYDGAFSPSERQVAPNSPLNLFREPTQNSYHVDAASDIGQRFDRYIDGITDAICQAIGNWMQMTVFATGIVSGPVCQLLPGGVVGPLLMSFVQATGPNGSAQETAYTTAIATSLGLQWQIWQTGISGTLMYPGFAAWPAPVAPPTPNVPMPLVALPSAGEAGLSPDVLKALMVANLGDPRAQHAQALFDALSRAFYTCFQQFKAATMVNNVLGFGSVPTYAPPFVPAGPVLGSLIPTPGVLV